ncbi:hypothetical protein N0V90_008126 [Kalmusia sp. IMI 367209]|nr:hypothetical protein N0V90_008126 [Kalmusia sp. IMI 367209]
MKFSALALLSVATAVAASPISKPEATTGGSYVRTEGVPLGFKINKREDVAKDDEVKASTYAPLWYVGGLKRDAKAEEEAKASTYAPLWYVGGLKRDAKAEPAPEAEGGSYVRADRVPLGFKINKA